MQFWNCNSTDLRNVCPLLENVTPYIRNHGLFDFVFWILSKHSLDIFSFIYLLLFGFFFCFAFLTLDPSPSWWSPFWNYSLCQQVSDFGDMISLEYEIKVSHTIIACSCVQFWFVCFSLLSLPLLLCRTRRALIYLCHSFPFRVFPTFFLFYL